jgi:hypothetical protein
MDDESLDLLRDIAAREADLPPQLHRRVAGSNIVELRQDAAKLAEELGIRPTARDEHGRFTSCDMTARIRAAAGRA